MLKKYIKSQNIKNGPVFITKTGKPLDRSNIWKMLKDLCEGAGVPKDKVFPHNFRHLFARTFYSLQKDIVLSLIHIQMCIRDRLAAAQAAIND